MSACHEGFTLDANALIEAIEEHKPALVYLVYPSNPTGTLYDDADIEQRVIAAAFDNVVMRTVSKLGLAGIRLGYMAGRPEWIAQFDKVARPPYNINLLTQATANFLLDHLDVLDAQAAELRAQRAKLHADLKAISQLIVYPSAGNFILVRVLDATAAFETLLSSRVLVKKRE